ncbi:glycosyl hydrolase family 18 protein [uncultured Aquimarina sp.]|uniref:glycosyl hydrolase family 18 protein n=1 Tax=uncultured Aquimarina sp. TaxID=575652 RepID=UPI0026203325|nr:glycosyl hydrolase family 18 protein [uncultured Aquimarina sp.]
MKKAKGKLGFIKKLFHHSDSTKLARKFIHQHHKELKEKQSPTFVTDTDTVKLKDIVFKTKKNFQLGYEVFGWYPYWEKDYYKYLNYNLLSTIAYFSYEVDPKTGNAITTHDWDTTPIVDSIKAYPDKKILLTVSNFGEKNNRKFLKNTEAVNQLIENLIQLLEKRKGNGVCIDFEGVAKSQKEEYTSFLLTLSNKLKKANKDYLVYITLPSVNWSEALDFNSINQTVDKFVIMGYDYYGKTSSVAGPVSPLNSDKTWEPYNLTTSVDYYLENKIPNNKLLLALPTYGSLWETKTQSLQSKVKNYIGSRTFSYIKKNIEGNEQIYIEPISKSAYSSFSIKGDKNQFRQCWFENDSSFVYKTKLIKEKKLAGLGIWALGYDKGYDDIWNVISVEMAVESENSDEKEQDSVKNASSIFSKIVNTLGLKDPKSKINTVEEKLVSITDYKNVLLYTMSFVLFFACVGFIWAMFSPNTRAGFFNNTSLKGYYIGLMLLLAIVIFRILDAIDDFIVMLIIGFLLGVLAFYIANGIVERKKKELP